MDRNAAQNGFTIIELMVALTIGLLVSLAAVNLFVSNQSSFNLQKGLSDVGDNGRFAMEFIAQQTRQAGYKPARSDIVTWPQLVTVATDLPSASGAGLIISRDNLPPLSASSGPNSQGGIGRSDRLTMQYFTPVDTRDCEGDVVPADSYVVVRFFLRADNQAGTGSALACEGGYHNQLAGPVLFNFNTTDTAGAVLLPAVNNFQVLIGIANTTAGACDPGCVQQYITIPAYAAIPAPKPPIATIRIGMLVSSLEKAGNSLPAPAAAINVLTETIPVASIPVDNRVRRVFSSTITYRNVL